MRLAFTSSVVAVAILGHAALGCCWHHTHATTCDDHQSHRARAHDHHDQSQGHTCAVGGDEHGDESGHDHVPCLDASCTYLTSKSVELSDSPALPAPTWLALAPSLPENCEGRIARGRYLCPVPAFSPEHCALTQVWRL